MKQHFAAVEIRVGLNFGQETIPVGRLATRNRKIYFEYEAAFLQKRLEISPIRLPLKTGLSTFDNSLFEGLPGVFNDSLPDGYEHWLVKFPNTQDGMDAGAIEYVYALMARDAGVDMPDVHLFPAAKGAGYFAIKRFDRAGGKCLHMHTASGLLHSDFRVPALDYEDLLTLTGMLTRDVREVEKMFRLAVFNVLAHNRDDHAKNFSFLMDETGQWKLSPAYDLTFSGGPRGEQSTMVMGEGEKPTVDHLAKLGQTAKLDKTAIAETIERTANALSHWPELSAEYGVDAINAKRIGETFP